MAHSDKGVEAARQRIREVVEKEPFNKTAREMLNGVEKDEAKEAREGEGSVERP